MPKLHSPEYYELADYFDLLNEKYAPYEQECEFLIRALQRYGKMAHDVLDLACGTGIHSLSLAQRGFTVTGVDNSPAMLAIAREKARAAQLPVTFREGDMKALHVQAAHGQFDLVLTVNYPVAMCRTEPELRGFLGGIAAALRPGGVLVMDFLAQYGPDTSTSREWVKGAGVRIECVREWKYDRARQVVADQTVYYVERNGAITRFDGYDEWRIYYPQEMLAYLRLLGGFNVLGLHRCWDLDGEPAGPNFAVVAEKPG